ncbi:MAG: alpha/beta hydrolase family protein [Victivallales bacterium]|nr:alpha/beta hydrolase family protein [Victivallales bacterium]
MALLNCNFFASSLGISTAMTVILPQPTGAAQIGMAGSKSNRKTFPVLYLLHGLSDDHTIWMRRTSIERYVAAMDLIVVMPAVDRSFYCDMQYGGKYWEFISEELPETVARFFPVGTKREETFAAGLSMGGYGALKLGLRLPERFAAVASLSGVTDIAARCRADDHAFRAIFGDSSPRDTADDLFYLSRRLVDEGWRAPQIFQCCGTEDFLYEDNRRFHDHLKNIGMDTVYREMPGNHNWGFWDDRIKDVLAWLPLPQN